jgi:hypothetical protein
MWYIIVSRGRSWQITNIVYRKKVVYCPAGNC